MPRIAGTNRGNGLSLRSSENVGNVTKVKGKGTVNTKITSKNGKGTIENEKRRSTGVKRQAEELAVGVVDCNTKTRRRAALEEITNVSFVCYKLKARFYFCGDSNYTTLMYIVDILFYMNTERQFLF